MGFNTETRHGYAQVLESLREHADDSELTPEQEARIDTSTDAAIAHREARARMTDAERSAARVAVKEALEDAYSDTI
ncbi:hypothetical protein [Mycobacterium sp.]|uniref:hypothetical protein n=1 Tax=Mycobacterium sp. TaxID=1785 RepID=UPI002D1E0066|nr:hypothetical protein [Mycobacterium sp.]HKP44141.1 hypothetical protein [Mycobacterium sp.]